MIFNDIGFQSASLHSELGVRDGFPPFFKVYGWGIVPSVFPFTEYVSTEVKDCGKMTIFTDEVCKFAFFHVEHFTDSKGIVFLESMFL